MCTILCNEYSDDESGEVFSSPVIQMLFIGAINKYATNKWKDESKGLNQ